MLAYRHAFHAGNHADVLKHTVLALVLRHLNAKDKGWRYVDTHAGAGGYSLESDYAKKRSEHVDGIGRVVARRADAPPPVAELLDIVDAFNPGRALTQYPGSPAIAHARMRPQDQLRLFERHPTDHKILASYLGDVPGVEVTLGDGYAALRGQLPPPTRRAVVLVDPSYELPADYPKALAALREALARFAPAVVVVWLPQLRTVASAELPQRLKAAAQAAAPKGWLHARLTVARADRDGFGLIGSSVFVANPPHTLEAALRTTLPWLADVLDQGAAASRVEVGGGARGA